MVMSVVPPAGQGTIIVTGFVGNCWADAAAANATAAAPVIRRRNMVLLLWSGGRSGRGELGSNL